MTIRYKCDTANGRCYVAQHMPDWAILNGCFDCKSPKIRVTDIDGAVEINGHVLFLEWKGRDSELSGGQAIAFRKMTASAPTTRVLVLYGDKGEPSRATVFVNGRQENYPEANLERVRDFCRRWAQWATGPQGI